MNLYIHKNHYKWKSSETHIYNILNHTYIYHKTDFLECISPTGGWFNWFKFCLSDDGVTWKRWCHPEYDWFYRLQTNRIVFKSNHKLIYFALCCYFLFWFVHLFSLFITYYINIFIYLFIHLFIKFYCIEVRHILKWISQFHICNDKCNREPNLTFLLEEYCIMWLKESRKFT